MAGARSIVLFGAAILVLVLAPTSRAQVGRESIVRGKAATALVQVSGRGEMTGTAFCVDASGLFVTNAHVVEQAAQPGARIKPVLRPGEQDQKVVAAKVYRRDEAHDLALLQIDPVPGLTALALGREDALYETLATTAFGYPFGSVLAFERDGYPNVSVSVHRISSLRKKQGELALLQIDGQLNPGNSGGPLLDPDGMVIGVAQATVKGSGINFAIPVGHLARFLAAPGLVFDPPLLTFDNRGEPVTWTIRAVAATPTTQLPADLGIAVTVTLNGGNPRTFAAQMSDPGVYQVTVTPVPVDLEGKGPSQGVETLVEARQGTLVLATVKRQTKVAPPTVYARIGPRTVMVRGPLPARRGEADSA